MIFANDDLKIYDDLRSNMIWYNDHKDLLQLEDCHSRLARAVLDTWNDLHPRDATEFSVQRFNDACEVYRGEGMLANAKINRSLNVLK